MIINVQYFTVINVQYLSAINVQYSTVIKARLIYIKRWEGAPLRRRRTLKKNRYTGATERGATTKLLNAALGQQLNKCSILIILTLRKTREINIPKTSLTLALTELALFLILSSVLQLTSLTNTKIAQH